MMKRKIGFMLCYLMLFFMFGMTIVTKAQEQAGWSAPYRLSSTEGEASEGFMVADQYGYVHVFWVETGLPDARAIIQYARFDGETWSPPLDIYATEAHGSLGFISPFVDQYGRLHLAWSTGNFGPVFYANAPAHDALSAKHWANPLRVDIPAYKFHLRVDTKGILHLLYANFYAEEPGVYYIRSEDYGETWSSPYWLDPDIPYAQPPSLLQFTLDGANGLHAIWSYLDLETLDSTWIRYAHSLDDGTSWSDPFSIDEADETPDELRLPYPELAVQDQIVHVVWAGDNSTHREYRFSTDRGETWSETKPFFGNLIGQAIGGGLNVDATGRIHYITQVRNPKAIWHAYWDQDHWTNPSMVYLIARYDKDPEEANRIHAHNVRLAIGAGNQMVTTFTNSPGEQKPLVLYAMHRTLNDISSLSLVSTPTPTITPTPQPTPTSISSTPTPTPRKPRFVANSDSLQDDSLISGPSTPLWIAIIPVLVLIVGTVALQVLGEP